MKKIVRILGLCVLVALAFNSCKKNETKTMSFKATAASVESTSKVFLDPEGQNYRLSWELHDGITVFKMDGGSYDFRNFFIEEDVPNPVEYDENNVSTATFHVYNDDGEFMEDIDVDHTYTAFYPIVDASGTNVSLTIPEVQGWVDQNFEHDNFPMVGKNEEGVFKFHSDAGLLCVKIKRSSTHTDPVHLDSLVLSVPGTETIAGVITYQKDGSDYGFTGTSNKIKLLTTGLEVTTGAQYCVFVLPKDHLANGFTLRGWYQGEMICECYGMGGGANLIHAQGYVEMPTIYLPQTFTTF